MACNSHSPDSTDFPGFYIASAFYDSCGIKEPAGDAHLGQYYECLGHGASQLFLESTKHHSMMRRFCGGSDDSPSRTLDMQPSLSTSQPCGQVTMSSPYTAQSPEIYNSRGLSPAEQSTGSSSQWSASHYDDASTPQTAIYSSTSSDYAHQLNFKDWPNLTEHMSHLYGGGVQLSKIQAVPDEHETIASGCEQSDAECDPDYVYSNTLLQHDANHRQEYDELLLPKQQEDSDSNIQEEDADASGDYNPVIKYRTTHHKSPLPTRVEKVRPAPRRKGVSTNKKRVLSKQKSQIARAKAVGELELPVGLHPFPCPFAKYKCPSTFTTKNEWKRHVATQHIKLGFWRCDLCPPFSTAVAGDADGFNDFNRKDLYTEHLRRMHAGEIAAANGTSPIVIKRVNGRSTDTPIREKILFEAQQRCYVELRSTPPRSRCLLCPKEFEGPTSWGQRMDHVGNHFERDRKTVVGASVEEDNEILDPKYWNNDEHLERWLVREGLAAHDEKGEWCIGDGTPVEDYTSS